ncbi:glycosyltransferase [Riemerella anatipestifer]|nr:glycosyltransferase [Riemerella anatipestifer]MDY3528263.1 glycosyltransferase [Riemerella anatipestifer]
MVKKVSIIVSCYNQAQYLDECLQSVWDQTYTDWECIIVDDGSPDHTEEVTRRWIEKDQRFVYLKKENGGLSSARNFGIKHAQGFWILPLDADDKIGNRYLELASEKFEQYDLIYCFIELFGAEQKKMEVPFFDKQRLLYSNPFSCSCLFPKEKWEKIGGYDETLVYGMEDWEFWINMIYNTPTKVYRLDYIGFYYRRKQISMNVEMNANVQRQREVKEYFLEKHRAHYVAVFDRLNEMDFALRKNRHSLNQYEKMLHGSLLGRVYYKVYKWIYL